MAALVPQKNKKKVLRRNSEGFEIGLKEDDLFEILI
jgi:hypothetical protein